jgi:hypothetical protein
MAGITSSALQQPLGQTNNIKVAQDGILRYFVV